VIKIAALIQRRPDVAPAEFLRIWREEHPRVVVKLPGLRRYRQNHPVQHRKLWAWDGMAELWFDDVAAVRNAFNSAIAAEVRAHEQRFIDSSEWFLVEEKLIFDSAADERLEVETSPS
jgi:uncharacterized protein (TIGR02118 family)